MKNYLKKDEWSIIEEGFSESIFSLGNGRFGQRANFEEGYSGETLQGSYVAGVYYPDKTRVGWWKNGYPDNFAKVLNAASWIGIGVAIDGEQLDLAKVEVKALIKPTNYGGTLTLNINVDGDVWNEDTNYDEQFWNEIAQEAGTQESYVVAETKKTEFHVATGMTFKIYKNGEEVDFTTTRQARRLYAGCLLEIEVAEGDEITIEKFASVVSSMNYEKENLINACQEAFRRGLATGFDAMLNAQASAWAAKWNEADVRIEGDVAAQQGVRFNIFQLYQTYTGEDERLNIGPKGFTGEKYGGCTYWDTEAYCIPFYMATGDPAVVRNLLIYRYKQLPQAMINAQKQGFKDGAALYPMVTMTGIECHNEWEITFEEIHRNGAIAYAIYDYINYTGDKVYLRDYGTEVLIGIARFWAQRVHYSQRNEQYMMHGVTGPNEYENNINNNWYTNYIAVWCLNYCMEAIEYLQNEYPEHWTRLEEKTKFHFYTETNKWKDIVAKMYYPEDKELGIFVQHDGFLDKEMMTVNELSEEDRPINQKWSWDRILRSVFIKQADVLQGLYFFEDDFDEATHRRNFDFYEPMTVHESSLSPCVHSILAAKLGKKDKAYEMYARSAMLDLEDYNNDTEDGLHITSMAGSWMAVIKGFAGMRVKDGAVSFNAIIPKAWEAYSFKVRFRGKVLSVSVTKDGTEVVEEDLV